MNEESLKEEEEEEALTTSINHLPPVLLHHLFTFLPLENLLQVSLVCTLWHHDVLSDENGPVWKNHCLFHLDKETLSSPILSSCVTFKSKLRAFYHAWNPRDCSRNVVIHGGFTMHRNPVTQSSDGARGKIGFKSGRHAWEVKWEGPLGTVATVGVATEDADLKEFGYIPLLGNDEYSWGWNLVENILHHNGENIGNFPEDEELRSYRAGDIIKVILDCEEKTLEFQRGQDVLGIAFKDLPEEVLYPAVSVVYGNSEVSMVYLGIDEVGAKLPKKVQSCGEFN